MRNNQDRELILSLQKLGLSYDESLVYFTLVQHGKDGTTVKDLKMHLELKRTTIYSILNRLIEKGCVVEEKKAIYSKKPKIFIAISPATYFNTVLEKKRNELTELEELKLYFADKLNILYEKGLQYEYKDLDPFLKPYFKPLLDKGWKVTSQLIEKGIKTYGHNVYDCQLQPVITQFVPICGFLVLEFDHNLKGDQTTISYFLEQLRRKVYFEIQYQIEVQNIKINDGEIEFYGNKFPSFIINGEIDGSSQSLELGTIAILPIKNKIFVLWGEKYDIILQMVASIRTIETNLF